ncbi:MAG: carboxypeptidase regulatory-like domain-containing protein [Euryarchaeota archaeon]|nr:carboxypeptidase regulatory-like domain-containing protein [Euryarchaeota archaeon]
MGLRDGTNVTGDVTNPYVIEARHTYTGPIGRIFTAKLTVWDTHGAYSSDNYLIEIKDKTLDVEINDATDEMLWWLHKQQRRGTYGDGVEYGYWYSPHGAHVSFTGAATEAFEINGHCLSGDPEEDPYVDTVQKGLNYLFNQFHTYSIGQDQTYCPLGDPDTNGNGIGLACYDHRQMYDTGTALMAISSSQTPDEIAKTGSANVKGRTYKDIAQDMVDFIAWGQSDPYTGVYEGGWRYSANYGQSDNSVSQWPVIGMEAAERNYGEFGLIIPDFVKPELSKWLNYSQGGDGGFGYKGPGDWENTGKTGAGCAMLSFCGVPTTDSRYQNALGFLDDNWYVTTYKYTNFGDYYTMYAIMKGMRIPDPDVEFIGAHDWYAEYSRYIVDEVNVYGEHVVDHSWLGAREVKPVLATAWAVLTLTKEVVKPGPVADAGPDRPNYPPTIPVPLDASGSYHSNPAKTIAVYEWDFESDGIYDYSSTEPYANHSYQAYYDPDGSINWTLSTQNYTVTLSVKDDSSPPLSDTDTCIVYITAPPWKPVANADGPYTGWENVPVKLNGSGSYDPESRMYTPGHPWYETIAKYEWDLDGDGEFDDSNETNPIWTWDTKGTYAVGVRVTDSQPSGPNGTYGDLDVDIDYAIVTIKKPEPILYAPNMWFDSEEQLYPASPFFYTDDINETSGEKSKNNYLNLSFDQKMDNFTIYYHIVDTGEEIVYEYWFYYAYNDWVNKHYHDWETVYVFVDKATGNVTRVVGSAHEWYVPNNHLFNPQFEKDEHVWALVEEGSHASCTDKEGDGNPDTTQPFPLAWRLGPAFEAKKDIPVLVGFPNPWDLTIMWMTAWDKGYIMTYNNSQYTIKEIDNETTGKFGGLDTFPNSPTTPIYLINPVPGGITTPIPIDGDPPTHPWTQTRYNNPYEIIPLPDRFVTGTVSGSDTTGAIVVILSEEPYYTFADENGNFMLNNIPYGVHDAVVNLDENAPYKQRFAHEGNTSLGVNGTLYIIPEEEAFRIEGIITDVEGNIVANATINVYDENNTKLFTTLTDENGTYLVTASAEHVYTVEAIFGNKTGTSYNVSGEPGEVVNVDLVVALPAIWANSTSHPEAIRWSGSKTVVNGKVHSNDGIKVSGSTNMVDGITSYTSTFEDSGSENVYIVPPVQVSIRPMPVYYDIEDYKPGGSEAIAAGTNYHYIDGKFHVSDSDIVLNGLYYVTDEAKLSGSNISGVFTIVAEGKIDISGSELNCSAYSGDLLFFSSDTKFKIPGSNSFFGGIIYIPKGEIDISGSTNTIDGSLFGNTVKLSGSEMRINAK